VTFQWREEGNNRLGGRAGINCGRSHTAGPTGPIDLVSGFATPPPPPIN
jgi:hypothetical protein